MTTAQLIIIGLGIALAAVGVLFAMRGLGTAQAGGSATKQLKIEGPAWLILTAMGAGLVVFGAIRNFDPPAAPENDQDIFDDYDDFQGPYDYGDDAYLDSLYDSCYYEDWFSCNELYFTSPIGSDYEWYGATCGGRWDWAAGEC
jgi:hypothetical protein